MEQQTLQIRRYSRNSQGERLLGTYRYTCTWTCKKKKIMYIALSVCILTALAIILSTWSDIFANPDNDEVYKGNICIWNALNSSSVNGLYSSDGLKDGDPLYSKTEDPSCSLNGINQFYLFFNHDSWSWSISSFDNKNDPLGFCAKNTPFLTECHSKWQIPPNMPQKQVTVTETSSCPNISCPQIILSFVDREFEYDERCAGTFDKKGINLYQKATSNIYLYFNPNLFRWICGDIMFINKCVPLNRSDGYANEQSWYNAHLLTHKDDHINISWSNGHNLTMKCNNDLTNPPTPTPTKSPTFEPTFEPTKDPTKSPTKPTFEPTINPTESPTRTPTLPTKSPTYRPTPSSTGRGCIASNSFVFIYPNYEKVYIDDLKIYDKILTYDELNGNLVWDQLLIKKHFEEGEYMNNELVPMIEFKLENNNYTLAMTGNHLLYVNNDGLKPADQVKIGDTLKAFDNEYVMNVKVLGINENVMQYPRNLYTYNGNLVVNGIAISQFADKHWNKPFRFIMKYIYTYSTYRNTVYCITKLWNEYLSSN